MIKRGENRSNYYQSKCSQVWVETVIYTLIGITLMGIIIGVITPQINKMIDKAVMTQTADTMNQIDQEINDALSTAGQQRELSLNVRRGVYNIDSSDNQLIFSLPGSDYIMSQPGQSIKSGDLTLLTVPTGKKYTLQIILDYNYLNLNLTYNNQKVNKTFTTSPSPYRLVIVNKDGPSRQIDFVSVGG